METQNNKDFHIVLLGIIYNPAEKKILIGKHNNPDTDITWCFPGGKARHEEDVDKTLKRKIKEETGFDVKNLGAFFINNFIEKPELMAVYFLTEVFEGQEQPGGDISELKWVSPLEAEVHLQTQFHSRLKEFLYGLA